MDDLEHWKGTKGDFKKLTGFALNQVDKEINGLALDRSKVPSGEDWEAMIVVGVAMNEGKGTQKECPSEWKRIKKKWSSSLHRTLTYFGKRI